MKMNKMKELKVEKVILHCSTADQDKLEKSMKLLKLISGRQPIKTLSKKRIPAFKIRPGLAIGCKVTLRGEKAVELLRRLFTGITSLKEKQISPGFFSFGIKEYIEIPSIPYQRDIGIMGFDVVVNLTRSGKRIENRKLKKSKMGNKQRITKEETREFIKKNFNLNIE